MHPPDSKIDNRSALLTVDEFLADYRIGRSSLYREANAGKITLHKFGRATRIARADAEQWAASLPTYQGSNSNDA